MPGTKEDAYLIILEITDHAYSPYLSFLSISKFKLTVSMPRSIFFVGKYSPEAIGDYIAGPNHVLPTTGSARFSSGLSVNDFLKRHSLIKITKTGIERLSSSVINLAKYENLEGHANSVMIRLTKEN